jgi:hypothetical protein
MTTTRDLVFPDAVEGAQDLFDRRRQLDEVQKALRAPARRTVVLLGGRLLGKTSVLNVVTHWAEDHGSYVVVRLAHAGSREAFMAEIVHGIHDRVGAGRSITRELFGRNGTLRTTTVARFVKTIQELAARVPRMRFLLCVDELDSLLQGCSDETARELLDLLLYLTEHARVPIRFLFTMSRVPERVRLSYGSPFLNQATIVELRPWSAPEAREFADWLLGDRPPLDEAGHAALFAATGGHPYFTKAVLRALQDGPRPAPAGSEPQPAAIASAVRRAACSREVDIALSNLLGVYLPAGAPAVLDRAADSPTGVAAASIRDAAPADETFERLVDAGLLTRDGRRYLLRLGLWRQWRSVRGASTRRPRRWVGLVRAVRRFLGGRAARVGLLSSVVLLLALAFGPGALFPDKSTTIAGCPGPSRGLRVHASYPSYVSTGDEHELRVRVEHDGTDPDPIDGYVGVEFPAGGSGRVDRHGDTGLTFDRLRPGEQRTLTVAFTHTQPGRLLPDTRPGVPVVLTVQAAGRPCRAERWSIPVAPLPYLRNIQNGALGLVFLLPVPLLIELLARRISEHRTSLPGDRRRPATPSADPAGR